MGERGALSPGGPAALGARPDGAIDGGEQQGGADGERAPGIRQVPIDEGHKAQAIRHGFEGGDIAVLVRAYCEVGVRGPEEAL